MADCCVGPRGRRGPRGAIGPIGPRGPTGPAGAVGGGAVIPYSAGDELISVAGGPYWSFGFGFAKTNDVDADQVVNFVVPVDGTLTGLAVNSSVNSTDDSTVVTIKVSSPCNAAFADTALTVTIPAGTTNCYFVAGAVPVLAGDRVEFHVVLNAAAGALILTGGLLYV